MQVSCCQRLPEAGGLFGRRSTELFCRSPDGIRLAEGSRLTPIPIDKVIESLSAIVLDDAYYAFSIDGRRNIGQLSWIGAEQLIPLKARAWSDLTDRKANGDSIDTKDIRKHAHDAYGSRNCLRRTLASRCRQNSSPT